MTSPVMEPHSSSIMPANPQERQSCQIRSLYESNFQYGNFAPSQCHPPPPPSPKHLLPAGAHQGAEGAPSPTFRPPLVCLVCPSDDTRSIYIFQNFLGPPDPDQMPTHFMHVQRPSGNRVQNLGAYHGLGHDDKLPIISNRISNRINFV